MTPPLRPATPPVGVVNRFGGRPDRYRIGAELAALGVQWVPLELADLSVHLGAGPAEVRLSAGTARLADLHLGAVMWRISENDTAAAWTLLEALDATVPTVVNPLSAIALCADKATTCSALAAAGLPVVPTVYLPPGATVPDLGAPVVVKPARGAGGRAVRLAAVGDVASTGEGTVAQPYAGDPSTHRRVLVCAGQVVLTTARHPRPGSLANNLAAGGTEEQVASGEESDLAVEAATAVGAHVAGVDLVRLDGRWAVLEVNSSPGIQGLEDVAAPAVARTVARLLGAP